MDLAGDTATGPTLIYGGRDAQTRTGIQVFPWHALPDVPFETR